MYIHTYSRRIKVSSVPYIGHLIVREERRVGAYGYLNGRFCF